MGYVVIMKEDNKVTYQVVAIVAGQLSRIDGNGWNVFSEECLKNIAKNDPERFTFKDGKLFATVSIDKKCIEGFENTSISMGCSIKDWEF